MLRKFAAGILLSLTLPLAIAGSSEGIRAKPDGSGYLQDSQGIIVRSGSGLCWHAGNWTPGDAVIGCDGALLPPIAKPTAPPIAAATAPQSAATPQSVPPPAPRCDFSVTLDSDAAFGFNQARLGAAARHELDRRVIDRLAKCAHLERVRVIGHADRLGTVSYNQMLSERRAAAVAMYLYSKGVSARIEAQGVGASEPVASCSPKLSRSRLLSCLAADRRVTIEAEGEAAH